MGVLAVAAAALAVAAPAPAAPREYVVLYGADAPVAVARLSVRAAGGTLVRENLRVGVATATSLDRRFAARLEGSAAIAGVAPSRLLGRTARMRRPSRAAAEPLAGLQWNMAMIHATPEGSYAVEQGDPGVLVGLLDSGVDGTHPELASHLDTALSRNFVVDRPAVDGPCEVRRASTR